MFLPAELTATFVVSPCPAAGVVPVTTVRADEQHYRTEDLPENQRDKAANITASLVMKNSEGLPIAVQVMTPAFQDEKCLRVMREIESLVDFKDKPKAATAFQSPKTSKSLDTIKGQKIRIACLGNSIQYYNDCPRLLERMFSAAHFEDAKQDSCLRGGASIISLWEKGNGMQDKFATPNAQLPTASENNQQSYDIGAPNVQTLLGNGLYDFAIINDHTQSPARRESRNKTHRTLEDNYAPLLSQSNIVPIFVQTAAYRVSDIRGTADLGSFDEYQTLLEKGYDMYKQQMDGYFKKCGNAKQNQAHIAPVGLAYKHLYHSDRQMWKRLYHTDDFHPSPHGTLLQAFVLFLTLVHALLGDPVDNCDTLLSILPATYDTSWWDRARRMQPPDEDPLPLPTQEEAEVLRQVALQVCRNSWNK